MKKLITLLSISSSLVLSIIMPGAALAASNNVAPLHMPASHAAARLHAVGNSGVEGFVDLRQLKQGGTRISLIAFGLKSGHNYVSLYYSNHVCDLEPYSADDVIGGLYAANSVGVGFTHGNADDDLDEIHSVSVRDADNFNLLACANIHSVAMNPLMIDVR